MQFGGTEYGAIILKGLNIKY